MNEEKARELWMQQLEAPLEENEAKALNAFLQENPSFKAELDTTSALWNDLARVESPVPSDNMDLKFDAFLRDQILNQHTRISPFHLLENWLSQYWKVGLGALAIGLIIGIVLSPNKQDEKMNQLAGEVSDLKKMMVLSLIEKPQAQDRIRAVSMVSEVKRADVNIIDVLVSTMNTDKSINVRLAAIDALVQYGNNEQVREALIKTIPNQKSPLVLVTLADALVQISAKGAGSELQKVLDDENVDESIKSKLKATIQTLKEI